MVPAVVLKRMIMGNFSRGYVDAYIADSIDFMVEKVIIIFCFILLEGFFFFPLWSTVYIRKSQLLIISFAKLLLRHEPDNNYT